MKKGFISPYQLGSLAATASEAAQLDLEAVFYSSAFQAGLDRFLVYPFWDDYKHKYSFVKERLKYVRNERAEKQAKSIRDTFKDALPAAFPASPELRDKRFREVRRLIVLLEDVIVAMSESSSVLVVTDFPDVEKAKAHLPPELYTPVKLFLSNLKQEESDTLIPKAFCQSEDAERLIEILSSDLCVPYRRAHEDLDSAEISRAKALAAISSTGEAIYKRAKDALNMRRNAVGVLTFTPKLVDTFLGKVPGVLAEALGKLGAKYYEDRRRIVVYNFRPILQQVTVEYRAPPETL